MVRNQEKLELATYYRKRGFSYTEIAKLCGVSKGTVSNWLAKKRFSKQVKLYNTARAGRDNAKRLQLLNKARQAERSSRYREALRSANTEFKHYQKEVLFLQGLALLCASGTLGANGLVQFSSSQPALHRLVASFLNRYGQVSRESLRFWLTVNGKDDEASLQKNWQRQLKLSSASWRPAKHLKNAQISTGTGTLRVYNTELVAKLSVYQEKWKKMALQSEVL